MKIKIFRILSLIVFLFLICAIPGGEKDLLVSSPNGQENNKDYGTSLRFFIDIYGHSTSFPLQFEIHALRLALVYRGIGVGTSGFKIYGKDLFDDFKNNHKLVAYWTPLYFYYIPFSSKQKTGDVIPVVAYSYLGLSAWGLKQAKFLDFGLGFNFYLLDFRAGYNTFTSDSRNCFIDFDNIEEVEDYPVSWNGFYISLNLSTGFWIAF
ncbi:hypothetical protein KAW48_05055 [candidate division WOR-3 bacterium]|nr:hypothetical protein [candidate division WOR-3 bacterium]